jgi:hypothetical protein
MFGHQSLILHVVTKLVHSLVVHDGIFPGFGGTRRRLFLKPFLDFDIDGVVRCKSPTSENCFQFVEHFVARGAEIGAV